MANENIDDNMLKIVYDPTGRNTDIFKTIDNELINLATQINETILGGES